MGGSTVLHEHINVDKFTRLFKFKVKMYILTWQCLKCSNTGRACIKDIMLTLKLSTFLLWSSSL